MDVSIFEGNIRILDKEFEALAQELDVISGASEEYGTIIKNVKTVMECQAIAADKVLAVQKFEEEQRQFVHKWEAEDANFDAKLDVEREKMREEIRLAQEKLEEERRQAEQRHAHDVAELEEERRHNLKDEAMRLKAEHDRNLITAGGIVLTTGLAALIFVGEMGGGVLGSGATSLLKLVRFF